MSKEMNIDIVLESVKRVRASLAVMNNSIDALFEGSRNAIAIKNSKIPDAYF